MCEPDGYFLPIIKEMKAKRAKEQEKANKSFQEQMSADAKQVWEEMMRLAMDPDTPKHIRGSMMDSILDRAGVPRNQKSEQTTEFKGVSKSDREDMYADVLKLVKGKKAATPQ